MKGVFTVGEQNIRIQADIDNKTAAKADRDESYFKLTEERDRKEKEKNTLLSDFQEECWKKTANIRKTFPDTQKGFKRKAQFAEKVLQTVGSPEPGFEELKTLYETAFDPNSRAYPQFKLPGGMTRLQGSNGNELLAKPLACRGDSPFADFIKALNADDWVRHGHERFLDAGGVCPYCQQELPCGFEERLAECFDERYQDDVKAIRQFYDDYYNDMQDFINLSRSNLRDAFPKINIKEYEDKLNSMEKFVESNLQKIDLKIREPSSVVELDNYSVKNVRTKLNALVIEFNKLIRANNYINSEKQKNQEECVIKVWELIAFTLKEVVSSYIARAAGIGAELKDLSNRIDIGRAASRELEIEIADLNKRIVSAAPTITNVNKLLRDSGFQGFSLREKPGRGNVYEVVRPDGQIAANLSDGERNFIAFLYFYHLARGSHNDADAGKDKIVVIDDPVSGMDFETLLIVSAFVREMIAVCGNNAGFADAHIEGNYIKQIFILTHNLFFHREITRNQTPRYNGVSFYMLEKENNVSTVQHCIRRSQNISGEMENFNPSQNLYPALKTALS